MTDTQPEMLEPEAKAQSSVITRVYALGSNGSGQLGVGHFDDLSSPQLCIFVHDERHPDKPHPEGEETCLASKCVKKIVAGGNHTLLLTTSGELYNAGANGDGRHGVGPEGHVDAKFRTVSWGRDKKITDIAATWEASFLVQNNKTIHSVGSGSKGELGAGETVAQSSRLNQIFNVEDNGHADTSIKAISAGMNHVVVLLSDGSVYGWGASRKGQLGDIHKSEKMLWEPRKIPLSFKADQVATGRDFTFLCRTDGDHMLLGDAKNFSNNTAITPSSFRGSIHAGWSSIYVTRDGTVDGIGPNSRGQLPPAQLHRISNFAAGSEHCLALVDDDHVAAWGWGEHGNCGQPLDDRGNVSDRWNVISLTKQDQEVILGLGAGCATSFVWTTSTEEVRTWA